MNFSGVGFSLRSFSVSKIKRAQAEAYATFNSILIDYLLRIEPAF
jgi:hypothetical protein